MRLKPAIFLDRDGTLNYDPGYLHRIEDWRWLPGVVDALKALQKAGYELVVVSNQSGIARGYYGAADLLKLQAWLDSRLAEQGIKIAAWEYCPHGPDENCSCRKPEPGLILGAAERLGIDLAKSWMIGDKQSDAEAGLRAGCHSILLGKNPENPRPEALVCPDLPAAARMILERRELVSQEQRAF